MTDDPMTETKVGRMIDEEMDERLKKLREERREKSAQRGRGLEDWALIVGLVQAALYGLVEAVVYFLQSIDKIPVKGHAIPWVTIALFLGCILPKTVGRATAGRIWTGLGAAASDRIRGGK